MRLLTSSLMAVALVVVLVAGYAGIARTPDAQNASAMLGDVPEVVVTAERPGWLMPEVVVYASRMPEVVVRASRAPVTLSALPPSGFVN
jgi:hypothetical protein